MIEIVPNWANAWNTARTAQRKQKNTYNRLITQAEEEAEKLRNEYEEKNAYLFRSAAEKTRMAYENARAQLAAQQSKWAAHGLTGQSEAVSARQQDIINAARMQQNQLQTQLQADAAKNEQEKKSAWQKLREAISAYRRESHKKSRFGSLGAALSTLFR